MLIDNLFFFVIIVYFNLFNFNLFFIVGYEFFAAIGTTEKEVVATKIQAEKTTSRNESITSQLKNV